MLKYTQITWSWTVKSILRMVCVCIQSRTHFAFNFVVSRRLYICFQARGKVLIHSTSHYSSCLKLSVSSAEQITLSEALTLLVSLSRPLSAPPYLSFCLSIHACWCVFRRGSCCYDILLFRIITVWFHLTKLVFFFSSPSLSLCLSPVTWKKTTVPPYLFSRY